MRRCRPIGTDSDRCADDPSVVPRLRFAIETDRSIVRRPRTRWRRFATAGPAGRPSAAPIPRDNVHYPYDYGFIPQSYYDDEDPFDVMVLVEDQTFPGCVVEARPVALMKMDDDGEQDDKVIAVPTEDPRFDHIEDLDDIPQQTLDEIDEFFATYKNLEAGKEVETLGWEDKAAAKEAIEHAQELYDEQFA